MILRILDDFQRDPAQAIITLLAFSLSLVVAITVHEFSHALAAASLGDRTAQSQGRLSLNPVAHLDPVGTALILFAGFGWGRPTPVNPFQFLHTSPRQGMALVSLAGPISNIVTASLFAIPIRAGLTDSGAFGFALFGGAANDILGFFLFHMVFWNLILATFNLLPVAPLDGFKVVLGLLPPEAARSFARLEQYGPGILLLIIMLDFTLPGPGILSSFINPILNVLTTVVLGRQVL
ncbi:MAG: site-2 protease family protein [SAR202 cluster bacterium]|jgi:Zn-dependent protease|nr:site-2 protease family protein [SAR202 cluster bacterium]MDP6713765.1 site-2 protease family protein [SAR202 cluster bacterium]